MRVPRTVGVQESNKEGREMTLQQHLTVNICCLIIMAAAMATGCSSGSSHHKTDQGIGLAKSLFPDINSVTGCEVKVQFTLPPHDSLYQLETDDKKQIKEIMEILAAACPCEFWAKFEGQGHILIKTADKRTVDVQLFHPHYYWVQIGGEDYHMLYDSYRLARLLKIIAKK
jgi:hypothetical protein